MHKGKQEKNPLQSPLVFSSSIFHLRSTFCTGLKLNSSAWWPTGPVSLNFLSPRSTLSGPGFPVYLKERGMCLKQILSHGLPSLSSNCFEMFVIFCFLRNFCLIPAHLPYVVFFSLEAAHNQREIPTLCQSFPVDLVFRSCSPVRAKEAAVTKAKYCGKDLSLTNWFRV